MLSPPWVCSWLDKITALQEWLQHPPKSFPELQIFLSFAAYYRTFGSGFVQIDKHPHRLVAQQSKKQSLREVSSTGLAKQPLRHISASYPHHQCWLIEILVPLSFSTRMLLGMLLSTRFSMGRPEFIAFGNRTLNDAERNFQLTDASSSSWSGPSPRFSTYLNGRKFHALTDSNPLTYLVTSTKLSATDHRWLSSLASFDFSITYWAGKVHSDTDGPSRMPYSSSLGAKPVSDEDTYIKPFLERLTPSKDTMICPPDPFQAICHSHQANQSFGANQVPVQVTEAMSSGAANDTIWQFWYLLLPRLVTASKGGHHM